MTAFAVWSAEHPDKRPRSNSPAPLIRFFYGATSPFERTPCLSEGLSEPRCPFSRACAARRTTCCGFFEESHSLSVCKVDQPIQCLLPHRGGLICEPVGEDSERSRRMHVPRDFEQRDTEGSIPRSL